MRRYKKFRGKAFVSLIIGLNLILALAFIFQFNAFISENFKMRECEQKSKDLSSNNEKISFGLIEKNNSQNLNEIAEQLNFVKTEKIHYIKVLSGSMATK